MGQQQAARLMSGAVPQCLGEVISHQQTATLSWRFVIA